MIFEKLTFASVLDFSTNHEENSRQEWHKKLLQCQELCFLCASVLFSHGHFLLKIAFTLSIFLKEIFLRLHAACVCFFLFL